MEQVFSLRNTAIKDDKITGAQDRPSVWEHDVSEHLHSRSAEDVKFSLDRVRDDKLPGFHVNNLKNITEVKITGPYQVQLALSALMPNLRYYLATDVGTIAIMSKKDLEANGNKVVKPVGTGPYKWGQWVKDSKVVLDRFDGYSSADGPVDGMLGKRNQYVDQLAYYIMKEPTTRIMALDKGDVDFTSILPYHMIDDLKKRDDITVYSALAPDAVWYMYYVNFNHPILGDVNFRKAMAYALDRGEITQAAVWGYGTSTFSVISPKLPAYTPDLEKMAPSYDPEKAKFYLKKAGLNELSVDLSAADAAFAGAVDAAVLYKEHAAKAGINIKVIRESNDGYWSSVWLKKPWCACYWGGYATEDLMLSTGYSAGAAWNDTHWNNEKFNQLLVTARAELNEAKRRDMYGEMQRILRDEGGSVVPMFANTIDASTDKVSHGKVSSITALDGRRIIERWWLV